VKNSVRKEKVCNIQIEFRAIKRLVKAIKTCLTEMHTIVKSGKENICLMHVPKQGDALSPLPFKFALEQTTRKAKKARGIGNECNVQLLSMLTMLNSSSEKIQASKHKETPLDAAYFGTKGNKIKASFMQKCKSAEKIECRDSLPPRLPL
jgi:hypothetical protein